MIIDWRNDDPGLLDERFDVCVVGAGAVGLTLAAELERAGRRVLVLEAGGRVVEAEEQDAYRSEIAGPQPHPGAEDGRFRALGGTTTRWGGQISPLNRIDFEHRPWIAGSGWPLQAPELEPFYRLALEHEGLRDAIADDDAVWRRLRTGPAPLAGSRLEPYFTRWCPQPDFAKRYRRVLERSRRLIALLHAPVVGVDLDGERVGAVVCRGRDGAQRRVRAQDFVFCVGGIETVRFFLQPTPGRRAPWSGHPLLGAGFQDHVDADGAAVVPYDRARFASIFANAYLGRFKYQPKFRLAPSRQRELETLNVAGTMAFPVSGTVARARQAVGAAVTGARRPASGDVRAMLLAAPELAVQAQHFLRTRRAHVAERGEILLRVHCEQEPTGSSRISLSDTRGSDGLFRARISWTISDRELSTMRTFVETVRDTLQDAGLAAVRPLADIGTADFRRRCQDAYHHMSGMRMSHRASDGLVDPDLKVFGTANLYVCSAAVFPTSGFSNPTHTAIALGQRLARHLSGPHAGR